MLRKPSPEWNDYVQRLTDIKKKSNREVLCTECWMILNYEQRGKHSHKFPEHKGSILTSSQFASEIQFYHIAFANNKVIEKPNGVKLIIQPCLFDPKKGAGHMQMIEDLCKEMHSSTCCDVNHNHCSHPSSNFVEESDDFVYKCDPLPQKETKVSELDSRLNAMIQEMSMFESTAYSQIFWSFNHFNPVYPAPAQQYHTPSPKVADQDSSLRSAGTEDHSSSSDLVSSKASSPLTVGRKTAFTAVKPTKVYKPVPTLNEVAATLASY